MSLLELPEELLIIIYKHLDLRSKLSVVLTCKRLAGTLCRGDAIGPVSLVRSAFSIPLLRHEGFSAIAPHIRELDLSHVQHLEKAWLIPLLTRMKRLRTLNISMTNVLLLDLRDVCEQCTDLTRLTVNYCNLEIGPSRIENFEHYKRAFRRLEYVHLYGDIKSFTNLDALRLLQNKHLRDVKLTAVQIREDLSEAYEPFATCPHFEVPFKTFRAFVKDKVSSINLPIYGLPVVEGLVKCGWEYVILRCRGVTVTMSLRFHEIAAAETRKSWKCSAENLDSFRIYGSLFIFMWHPDVFSGGLACLPKSIVNILNNVMPQYVCGPTCYPTIESIRDSYIYISPNNFIDHYIPQSAERGPQYWSDLNIDHFAMGGNDLKLSFIRMCHIFPGSYYPLKMDLSNVTFQNIVYLQFDAEQESYLSTDFFRDLFNNCNRLETLFYDNDVKFIQDALVHSKSLRNLMVFNRIKNPLDFVKGVAKCGSLENVHICDGSFSDSIEHMARFDEGLSELVENCKHLYNLEYHAAWGKRARRQQLRLIVQVLKKSGRDVRIDLAYYDRDWLAYKSRIQLNQFCHVFFRHDYFKLIEDIELLGT